MLFLRKNSMKNSLLYCFLPFHRHFLYALLHFTTMHIFCTQYNRIFPTIHCKHRSTADTSEWCVRLSVCPSVHCIVSDLPRRGGALCSVASLKASLPYRSWRTRRSTLIILCVPEDSPRCVAVPSGHLTVLFDQITSHGRWICRPRSRIMTFENRHFVTSDRQTKVQRLYLYWIILPIIFSMECFQFEYVNTIINHYLNFVGEHIYELLTMELNRNCKISYSTNFHTYGFFVFLSLGRKYHLLFISIK